MNILQQIATLLGGKLTKVHEKTVANKGAIEAEVTRAKASETLLDTNIKNETKRAHDEETRIELKAVDLVTKEETRATAAEAALSTKIDTDVKAEADRAKGAEQAIIGNLNAETTRAKAAEKANSDAITALDEKKVDKVEGKQLSTEDYTTNEKKILNRIDGYVTGILIDRSKDNENLGLKVLSYDPTDNSGATKIIHFSVVDEYHNGFMSPSQKLVLDNLISGDSALSILGTPSSTWQLNLGSGPKIKNSGGVFELRNADDNAYADLTVNALTIKGNVTQEGGSFITQAETVSAKDNTILLNSGETGAGVTKGEAGVEIDRGTLPKYKFIFDESDDRFKVGSEGDLWSVMLRDNETDLTEGGILTWDSTTKRAKTAFNVDDLKTKYIPYTGNFGRDEFPEITGPLVFNTPGEVIIQTTDGNSNSNVLSASYTNKIVRLGSSTNRDSVEIGVNSPINFRIYSSKDSKYGKIWTELYQGESSGLDADLLDGQHGSYYAKATDLGNYIPLSGTVADKPITGMFEVNDTDTRAQVGFYGKEVEHSDGIIRSTRLLFTNIVGAAAGGDPGSIVSLGCFGSENYRSMLVVGHLKNRPMLRFDYHDGDSTSQLKRAEVYHEGNLDISTFALKTNLSGYLPLSGGTMNGHITLPYGKYIVESSSTGWTLLGMVDANTTLVGPRTGTTQIRSGNTNLIHNKDGNNYNIWDASNDGAGSGLDADLLDGRQGSEYALASSLNSYLPLSAGSSKSLTGVLYANGAEGTGANGWQVNAKFGSNTTSHSAIEILAKDGTLGIGMHQEGVARMWVGTSTQASKNYFMNINKSTRVVDFNVRPVFNGVGLATVNEVPTSLPNPQSITFTGAATGTYNGSSALTINIPTQTSLAWGNITGKPSFATVATSGSYNDLSNKPSIPSVPSSLKNPYAITFTGAVTGTYDGSAAKTVNIPSIPSLSGGAGATSGQYVSGVTVSGHTVTVTKASLPTSLPANGGYASELRGYYYASGGSEKPPFFNKVGLFLRMLGSSNLGVTSTYTDTLVINTYIQDVPWCNALAFAKDGTARGWIVAQNPNNADWGTKKQIVTSDMLPTSLPASDVYSWAKASSKPSYAWSEITGKPTIPSLSGYATQSWVQSQGYLTSHQSLANYVTLNTTQTISGAKTFTAFVTCSAGAGTSSDIRLKKYINRMFDAEEVLSNLSGYRYVMKETGMHYAGLVAQEVQEVLPEAVREDENGFLTVDTYPIVAALVEANKAKDNRIKTLEDRITALEKKMNIILNKIR